MLFNSYPFVFGFLPALLFGIAILSRSDRHCEAQWFLVVASLAFYAWWNWHYIFLFICSIGFNYCIGEAVNRSRQCQVDNGPAGRGRGLLALGITANVCLLGYFKYRNFFIDAVGAAFRQRFALAPLVLPLAISFFTFEQITYLVSAFRGEIGVGDFLSYCLFISFFPHLIAGPIVRYTDIYPQLNRDTRLALQSENLAAGLMIFAIGLFKKVVIADAFRSVVEGVFDHSGALAFADAWGALLAFTVQIYFDFSGYSDMAIGLARIVGVRFPENFDSPYQAASIIEFWRRWHITLSYFLRDYLYIPLGGNRRGRLRQHLNLMVTMTLGGLWHGANWTFLLWGFVHGLLLSANHLWRSFGFRMTSILGRALTFFAVVVAWIFFRADSIGRAHEILVALAGLTGPAVTVSRHALSRAEFRHVFAALAIVLFCPNRQTIMNWPWRSDYQYAGAFAILAASSILWLANPPPFIYFQF